MSALNAEITVEGVQGHVGYPHRAANPVPVLVKLLAALQARVLDDGYPEFQPSNLEVTWIDVPNTATNIIPGVGRARLNIRFNPSHTGASLAAWIEDEARQAGEGFKGKVRVESKISGEAFLTNPGAFTALVSDAVRAITGKPPELSTTGGTSDAILSPEGLNLVRLHDDLGEVAPLVAATPDLAAHRDHAAQQGWRQLPGRHHQLDDRLVMGGGQLGAVEADRLVHHHR